MRRTHARVAATIISSLLIASSCASAATPVPSTSPSPDTRSPSSAPIVSPSSPPATSSPWVDVDPFLNSVVVTVSDRLRVRSQPRVSDDSVKFEPVLPLGTQLTVVGGPIAASGYTWYEVEPLDFILDQGINRGWVAMGDHDGTPWIAMISAPIAGLEFARATLARSAGNPADAKLAATSINAFGLDLYQRMRSDSGLGLQGKNIVFSPTSIALALAMARAGARTETAAEMDAVLRSAGWQKLAAQLNALDQALAGHNATWTDENWNDEEEEVSHDLSLRIANTAFGQRGWPIEQGYLDAIAEAFGAGLGLVDYEADPEAARKVINEWVSRQTAKRIPELLLPGKITDATRLALVNAIYLKANWLREFYKGDTADRAFTLASGTKIQVPTMSLVGEQEVPYASGSGWKATELRYLGAGRSAPLEMTLILPDEIDAFEAGLTPAKLASVTKALDGERARLAEETYTTPPPGDSRAMDCGTYAYSVHLYMPRFGIDTRAELVPILEKMGMRAAFDGGAADFSGITSPSKMFIAAVIHQANIDVDEKGTEAAAATVILGDTTGGCGGPQPSKIITLRLDQPFLFVLREVETGAILFMGRVVDPSVRS